jgi:hypothetical protein
MKMIRPRWAQAGSSSACSAQRAWAAPPPIGTDGMICGSGSYDKERKAGAYQIDPTTETVGGYISVGQDRHGCTASATKVVGTNGEPIDYWLYQGKATRKKDAKEAPPWPVPQDSRLWVVWPPKPEVFLDNASPSSDGRAVIWYRTPEAKASAPKGPPPDARPEDLGWKPIRLQVPTYPMSICRLVELPDGRLLGTAGAYEGNFLFDPATGKSTHLAEVDQGRLIVISTRRVRDSVLGKPEPKQGKLFVFDTAAAKMVREIEPVMDAKGAGLVLGVGVSRSQGAGPISGGHGGRAGILRGVYRGCSVGGWTGAENLTRGIPIGKGPRPGAPAEGIPCCPSGVVGRAAAVRGICGDTCEPRGLRRG